MILLGMVKIFSLVTGSFTMRSLCGTTVGSQARRASLQNGLPQTDQNVNLALDTLTCNDNEQNSGSCEPHEARFCCENSKLLDPVRSHNSQIDFMPFWLCGTEEVDTNIRQTRRTPNKFFYAALFKKPLIRKLVANCRFISLINNLSPCFFMPLRLLGGEC